IHQFKDHGIEAESVKLNFSKMRQRVEKVVSDTSGGIGFLMKKNKIEVLNGHATFKDNTTVVVGEEEIKASNIVLATGSKPSSLPGIEVDKERVVTSTEMLYLKDRPEHLVVIGGGVIGLELGQVMLRLGSKVSVVEYCNGIIPTMDKDLGKTLQKVFKKEGMEIYTDHAVQNVIRDGNKVKVMAKSNDQTKDIELESDFCLVSVGRKPYTDNLGLDKAGVKVSERGFIEVNDHLQTSVPNIYAIGDVIGGAMLAHKAEEEGVFVAELLVGQKPHMNYNLIPGVVYTHPEVASVGATEQQLKDKGVAYKSGSFPFKASGRARASNESEGFIKVLADKNTDEILGVHMIGPRAADMIAEAVVAMEFRASAEDISRICHAHPTYTEAFKEACLAATENRALHI
ncbi:MAG: dihydrolipoyl dehydrogenase, partial [Bdellovibrionales bacterium]|nr:dihydrolipoyl dehydrogenase [Bdellovibrionales bacterium]